MFKKQYKQAESQEKDPNKCEAYGCNVRASVKPDGHGWCCFAHAMATTEQWQQITRDMNDHAWLTTFITDIGKMDKKFEDWRGFATQFWTGIDDACLPASFESAGVYQYRMTLECLHRVGQYAKKPQARPPKVPRKPNVAFGI